MAIGLIIKPLAKLLAKQGSNAAKTAKGLSKSSKQTAKNATQTVKSSKNASQAATEMTKATAKRGMLKKALGIGGVGGGIGAITSALSSLSSSDKKETGTETPTPTPTSSIIESPDHSSTNSLVLFDFASMLDERMVSVPELPSIGIENADLPYVDATLEEDVAIPYDIEEMFDREKGALIIPKNTFLDFNSEKIEGITNAIFRLARNLETVNQQIAFLNNRTSSLEESIKKAQDLNRQAVLEYRREESEGDIEQGSAESSEEPVGQERSILSDAVKGGLLTALAGVVGASVAVGGTTLLNYFNRSEEEAEAARQEALDRSFSEEEANRIAEDSSIADEVMMGLGLTATAAGTYGGAKLAKKGIEKVANKTTSALNKVTSTGSKVKSAAMVAKTGVKEAIDKIAPKKLVQLAGKSVPGVSWLVGGAIAITQAARGDYTGASLTLAGSAGGIVTALPVAALEITREVYNAVYGTEENPFPHESDAIHHPDYKERQLAIYEPVTEYVGNWFEEEKDPEIVPNPITSPSTEKVASLEIPEYGNTTTKSQPTIANINNTNGMKQTNIVPLILQVPNPTQRPMMQPDAEGFHSKSGSYPSNPTRDTADLFLAGSLDRQS